MNDTTMTVVGNLVDDPELRTTSTGLPVVQMRVASTSRRFDRVKEAYVDNQTLFVSVTAWRALARNAAASLRKGQAVIVTGRFSQREYEVNEARRVAYEIEASAIGPDLSRGVTTFEKRSYGQFVARPAHADAAGTGAGRADVGDDLGEVDGDPVEAFLSTSDDAEHDTSLTLA